MTFYRTKNCPGCQAIEGTLNDLAIAFDCVALEDKSGLPDELSGQKLPLLVDEGKLIQGGRDIVDHLAQLAEFKEQWYKYQSDVCYCEDE
jgi:glutaredoxin